jgi:hypothetical protein
MNKRTINKAVNEAKRFLEAAKLVQAALVEGNGYVVGTKESGALKRSSLDLTRALADMRRPG